MVLEKHWIARHKETNGGDISQADGVGRRISKSRTFFSDTALIEDELSIVKTSHPGNVKAGIRRSNGVDKVSNFSITRSLSRKGSLRPSLDRHRSRILPPVPLSELHLRRKSTAQQTIRGKLTSSPSQLSQLQTPPSQMLPSLATPSIQIPLLPTPPLHTLHLPVSSIPTPSLPAPYLQTPFLGTPTLPSVLVIGDYTVETGPLVGEGGYSTVYSVTDQFTRKQLALKLVKLKPIEQSEVRQNLLDEVKLLKSLINVDHVVQLVSCRVTEEEIYMLMELGEGDLRKILAYIAQASRPLDVDFVRYWGGQVLKAVAAVHQHCIVHSDLKPANFLVVSGVLKLCDFGIADTVPDNSTSVHRSVAVGTLKYMAPETLRSHQIATTAIVQPQVVPSPSLPHREVGTISEGCWNNSGFGNRSNISASSDPAVFKVTKASDVWSCGVILYEMVYQKNPVQDFFDMKPPPVGCLEEFEVEHPKTAKGDTPVPLALHEVIRDCLRVTPKERTSAEHACNSLFFAPVSIDLQAVLSIARNAYKFGHDLGSANKDATPGKLEEHAEALYKKLTRLSKGM